MEIGTGRRWAMLAVSTLAQAASAVAVHGPAFLIPTLQSRGLSLPQAGVIAACPTIGVMLTLVLWGYLVDLRGERLVLVVGMVLTTVFVGLAALAPSTTLLGVALFFAGAAGASANTASGRVVVGWFPARRRGLAMGIRQMAQPVGVGVAAVSIAVLAERYGVGPALWVPTAVCGLAAVACALVVLDPPRPPATRRTETPSPYRGEGFLWRIHGASMLLVVPQFLVWTFALAWLVTDRGWSAGAAGTVVALTQILGALGRIGAGQLSDVVASRLRPMRWVAVAAAVTMLGLGVTAGLGWSIAVGMLTLATAVTVADNGLAFTAVAERAGPFWSGRALGLQNTTQFLTASAVPPIAAVAISGWGYAATFALAAAFPLLAIPLVPVAGEAELTGEKSRIRDRA